jgi:hypothetical protein
MANFSFRLLPIYTGLMVTLASGCQWGERRSFPQLRPESKDVTLTIEANGLGKGEFAIAGQTNLPQNTALTALALRYLQPTQSVTTGAPPTFALLDYQTTTVEEGQWETQLNLWQVAKDGHYQEAWQDHMNQLNLQVQPDDTVHFVITLAPQQFLATLEDEAQQTQLQLSAHLLRTTASGDALLWADDALPVDLPEGRTTPPENLAQGKNGGWGERYRLLPEPPLPYTLTPEDTRKTTAPPNPGEVLR